MKAEAAKLPGAGISPKPCPRKYTAEKGNAAYSVRIGMRSRLAAARNGKEGNVLKEAALKDRPPVGCLLVLRFGRFRVAIHPQSSCLVSPSHLRCRVKVGQDNNGYKNIEEFLPATAGKPDAAE